MILFQEKETIIVASMFYEMQNKRVISLMRAYR